jgi:hypothetical protein
MFDEHAQVRDAVRKQHDVCEHGRPAWRVQFEVRPRETLDIRHIA